MSERVDPIWTAKYPYTPEAKKYISIYAPALQGFEKEDLRLLPRRERDRTLGRDADAVTRAQDDVAEGRLSPHQVEPGAALVRSAG